MLVGNISDFGNDGFNPWPEYNYRRARQGEEEFNMVWTLQKNLAILW